MEIVTTHKNTDFDALASTIAGTLLYPGAVPVLPKNVNPNVRAFLSIHKDLFNIHKPQDIDPDQVRRLIVVDVNQWSRLEGMRPLKEKDDMEVILWDHHPIKGDIHADQTCCEEVGATITLMMRELRGENSLSPVQSTLFLIGLYEDTGSLRFPSTTSEDAYTAGYLLDHKADLKVLSSFLRPAYGEKQKNILFEMLQSAAKTRINGYSVSIGKVKIKGYIDNLAVVIQMYREIMDVDAAFGIFVEKDSKCMVIGRSNIEGLNVGMIMRSLGGGGHPAAGSAMLKSANPDTVENMIVDLIKGNQHASVRISDLMSFPVFSVTSDTGMKRVAIILRERGCTGVPVVDNGRIVGIISRRDFQKVRKDSALKAPVKAFMSSNVVTIGPGSSPLEAARLMVKHDIGRLPVVEDGRIIGIVTRSDAMTYFYDLMPA